MVLMFYGKSKILISISKARFSNQKHPPEYGEKLLYLIAMLAKFLDLNKSFSGKYGRKKKLTGTTFGPLLDCFFFSQEQNGSP